MHRLSERAVPRRVPHRETHPLFTRRIERQSIRLPRYRTAARRAGDSPVVEQYLTAVDEAETQEPGPAARNNH